MNGAEAATATLAAGLVSGLDAGDVVVAEEADPDLEAALAHSGAPGPATTRTGGRRKVWSPNADEAVSAALRRLCVRPWAVAGRDDDLIALVRRHAEQMQEIFTRLGWVLVVERDLVRLRKSPPPRRSWERGTSALTAPWFFLLVAAAESMPPRCSLAQLVTGARAAAAEADVAVTGAMAERHAIVAALKMLHARGVVEHLDGDVEGFLASDTAPVLLAVHHTRLLHVIANSGAGDPSADPAAWLAGVERESDVARRMRRRLIDDTLVHTADLDEAELRWLSARVRSDDGGPLATAFGLELERRAEGAAFVLAEETAPKPWERGDHPFPTFGTVAHASLKFLEHVLSAGSAEPHAPGPGWRCLEQQQVSAWADQVCSEQATGKGGWSAELIENPPKLILEVRQLLQALDVLRVLPDPGTPTPGQADGPGAAALVRWWVSPAAARWRLEEAPAAARAAKAGGTQAAAAAGPSTRAPLAYEMPLFPFDAAEPR